jgi:oligoendopeptidase F
MTDVKALPLRSEVPAHLTWDLSTIYANEADWESDLARAAVYPDKLAAFKGRTRRSGKTLLSFFRLSEECSQLLGKLSLYAHLRSDEDTTDSKYQAMQTRCSKLGTKIGSATAWSTPELLSIKPERLERFIATTPGLELYKHDFEELSRERAHFRSAEVEQVLSLSGEALGASGNIFGAINNADLKLPTIIGEDGKPVQLTKGNFGTFLDSKNRAVRKAAYEGMFETFKDLRNTMANCYAGNVNANIFRTRVRNYPSCVERALSGINVPVSVYDTLISTVHENLPLLHRYLEMRKRILGVDTLEWYDLYVPLVDDVDDNISFEDAQQTVLAAVAPLGEAYVAKLREGFASRWVDVVENKGKRAGAYSSGTWGTNPFILMNWQGKIDSMFTLAHEAGHSMHSFFSKSTQPYTYSGYTLFVAEVASTTNEALLAHYLLSKTTDPKMRLYIINKQLEGIRTTLVRQTMFAEFERDAHAAAEAGTPLTPDLLASIHKGLNEKYLGATVRIDDLLAIEWSRIPHFYRPFYVYQYATGISSATALARGILNEGAPAVERYLTFLKGGSSDYSINLLRNAGVDLSTPAPIQAAFDSFAEYLALFEQEYARL